MNFFSEKTQTFLLDGLSGKLEIMITPPAPTDSKKSIVGVICHPHPLYCGTMRNKVVTTVAKAFKQLGVKTVRFNFRGVGKSEGYYDNAMGETDDLRVILRWVKKVCPNDEIWLAGFSFGSYVAAKAANTDHDIARLITIAPTVQHYNYHVFTSISCPWLLVLGAEDEFVPLEQVKVFLEQFSIPLRFIVIERATHFFHGKLIELREALVRALV